MKRLLPSLGLSLFFLACTGEPQKPLHFQTHRDPLSSGMVISEVYGGGGSSAATAAYKYDFIELLNLGTTAVDISTWSVQYTSSTGGGWSVTPLTGLAPVQPGRSVLVRMGTSGTTGATLPAHDVSGGSAMSATSGKVALVASSTALTTPCPASSAWVDFVGYGTAANCSEGSPTQDTAADTSAQRSSNGCAETDVNATDFTVGTPSPRNNAAAVITCSGGGTGGGAGGGTGGGSGGGTGGGSSGVCTTILSWPTAASAAGYDMTNETVFADLATQDPDFADGGMDTLTLEAFFGGMPALTLPANATFTANDSYGTCEICAVLTQGCNSAGDCTREYFAQSGLASVSSATQSANSGLFSGLMTNVRFVEWDFVNDAAVPGGRCVVVESQAFQVTWPATTPTGGGSGTTGGGSGATGGGTGGGNATTGGGNGVTDAGPAADAGTGGGSGKIGGKSGCSCASGGEGSLALALLGLLARRGARRSR